MSSYLESDFCDPQEGLDYIFGYMSGVYGATFTRHFERVDPDLVRGVWLKELGKFLVYKPSLDYALAHLPATNPPSAITFRNLCNAGPSIPEKPVMKIERQRSQYEIARAEIAKAEALAKLKELRKEFAGDND
jgi:hypothetical protein